MTWVIVIGVLVGLALARAMYLTAHTGARPGDWFMAYHDAWTRAHPTAWADGTGACGGFYKGDVWVTGTPDFDRAFFRSIGRSMPRRWRQADMSARPGEIRIANRLDPGESVTFTLKPEGC